MITREVNWTSLDMFIISLTTISLTYAGFIPRAVRMCGRDEILFTLTHQGLFKSWFR